MCPACSLSPCACSKTQPLRLSPDTGRIVRGYPRTPRDEEVQVTHRRRLDPWMRALRSA